MFLEYESLKLFELLTDFCGLTQYSMFTIYNRNIPKRNRKILRFTRIFESSKTDKMEGKKHFCHLRFQIPIVSMVSEGSVNLLNVFYFRYV